MPARITYSKSRYYFVKYLFTCIEVCVCVCVLQCKQYFFLWSESWKATAVKASVCLSHQRAMPFTLLRALD